MNDTLINTLDADGQRRVANVREAAGRIWKMPLHRYYTDHTVAHSERVTALIDGLTAGMMGTDRRLAPDEVFVLLAATYLHDIGMQDERYADGDIETIRADHHEVTAELIYRAAQDPTHAVRLGLPEDPSLVEAVALVAKGHRKVDLSADEYNPLAHGGVTIRLRLLAALLRFGDELDIDHRRVDLELMKLVKLPLESQLHWWKCHYVSGVSIEDEYIRIAYRFPQERSDYEGFIVPLVESDIRNRLSELEEIFRANAIRAAVGKSQMRLMRLVQMMPAAVEALARKAKGGEVKAKAGGKVTRRQGGTGTRRGGDKPVQAEGPAKPGKREGGKKQATSSQAPAKKRKTSKPVTSTAAGNGALSWNTEAMRDLLSAAFDDGELTTLCFDHFRAVYEDFAVGMSRGQKIQGLLDFCSRHDQFERLADLIKVHNPIQYARYEVHLRPHIMTTGDARQSKPDVAPLRRQLAEAETNLQLIQERKSQYVLEVDVPLQLVKEERRLRELIARLEAQLESV